MEKPRYYVLDAANNVVPATLMQWADMFEDIDSRTIGITEIGDVRVTTVFMGHDFLMRGGDGAPVVFGTMIFGGPLDGEETGYSSYDDAKAGHEAAVRRATQK